MTEVYDMKTGNAHVFKCLPCRLVIITDDCIVVNQWNRDEHKYWQTICPKCGKRLYGEYYH